MFEDTKKKGADFDWTAAEQHQMEMVTSLGVNNFPVYIYYADSLGFISSGNSTLHVDYYPSIFRFQR